METIASFPFPWNKPAFAFTRTFFFYSSGETVTSMTSLSPLQPKKGKRRKEKADVPPAVPAKGRKLACNHHEETTMTYQKWVRGLMWDQDGGVHRWRTWHLVIIWSGEPHLDSSHNWALSLGWGWGWCHWLSMALLGRWEVNIHRLIP